MCVCVCVCVCVCPSGPLCEGLGWWFLLWAALSASHPGAFSAPVVAACGDQATGVGGGGWLAQVGRRWALIPPHCVPSWSFWAGLSLSVDLGPTVPWPFPLRFQL